ncbi:MAG: folate/biopterin family MFS transporter [Pseudanabaenaceae cyanobacterium bins.68]|nr:folate/biopterin family MFS transporter [Pseudanabaenaceae cyanobacterium bins.68]
MITQTNPPELDIQPKAKPKFSWDPELIAIAIIYFVQGAMGLAQLAVSFFLKDELHLSPAEVAALVGIAMLPWTIKPFYGLISDSLPILGYHRRPYILISSLLATTAWLTLAFWVKNPTTATCAIALTSLAVACSDAITDAVVVERARNESLAEAGSLQSFSWTATSLGAVLAAYLGGVLLEQLGSHGVFSITAALPLLASLASFAIQEQHEYRPRRLWQNQLTQLRQAFTSKQIILPAAFVFLWQATPTADSAFFFFTTNELHFNPEFLGRVQLVSSIAGLFGVWLFQRYLKNVPMRRIFVWTTLISTILGLSSLILVTHANRQLGIDDRWFSMGDNLILSVAGRIAFMPVLVLAARLCPAGVEATLFASLMSIFNLAGLCSYQFGALLTHLLGITESNFDQLWLLILITNLSTLLPLPLIKWLPEQQPATEVNP